MQSTFTHLSFAHVYREKPKNQIGFPKIYWSYKREFGKPLNPLKNNLLHFLRDYGTMILETIFFSESFWEDYIYVLEEYWSWKFLGVSM